VATGSEAFREAVKALEIGKRLPTAVYFARSITATLPDVLRGTLHRAERAASPDPAWNLAKLHVDHYAITFLSYPDFDVDPHPALAEATKINLNTGTVTRTNYQRRPNPPILHRKETFLSPDDPRIAEFAALTKQEEEAGLYRDPSRIGLRLQWQTLLKRLGLAHRGHMLVQLGVNGNSNRELEYDLESKPTIERHRTAIRRYDLSKPVKTLLERGLLRKKDTFFDYGCGHGMDIEALSHLGYQAAGWDPCFRPNAVKTRTSVVNLGYVLNVIEEPEERLAALREAYSLADRLLLVSVLVAGRENSAHTRPYRDGYLTKTNTFQKFYLPGELETLIEEILNADAVTLALGICAVFRDPNEAEVFESGRNRRRIDWREIGAQLQFSKPAARDRRSVGQYELHKELLDRFWQALLDFGRIPEPGEFDDLSEVRREIGSIKKALALVLAHNGNELWEMARKARSEDVLVYLAMTNFRKRLHRREIPPRIKNDIRSFFGDLNTAQTKGRELLFAAGDPDEIGLAVEGLGFGVFDRTEMQFTFHRSLLEKLPPILRVYVHSGAIRYGNPDEADLIKIHVQSGKLTFLHYNDFEANDMPILLTRIKVNLRNRFVQVFDHSRDHDEQHLAFKERFLPSDAPDRDRLELVTEKLRQLGFSAANTIHGVTRSQIEERLRRTGNLDKPGWRLI
jgi:DNA phosphorothioation-associated putative methyltransferase